MQYILSQALLAIAFSGMASAAPTEVKELQCNGAKYLGKLNLVQGEPAKQYGIDLVPDSVGRVSQREFMWHRMTTHFFLFRTSANGCGTL